MFSSITYTVTKHISVWSGHIKTGGYWLFNQLTKGGKKAFYMHPFYTDSFHIHAKQN